VKAGRLTQTQADAIKQRMKQNGGAPFLGGRPHPFAGGPGGPFFGGPGGPFRAGFDAAATYLDLTPQQLDDQLESGKSLADVAKAKNKDLGGLKTAIQNAAKARLDTAVKNKRITQSQENRLLSGLSKRIDTLVQLKGGRPPGWREHGKLRRGGPPPDRPRFFGPPGF
jgi:hypothetical protein